MHALATNVLLFGRLLRRVGVELHHSRLLDSLRALDFVGVTRREDVRATLRALLVHRFEDLARFDAAFDAFFRERAALASAPAERASAVNRESEASIVAVLEDGTIPSSLAHAERRVGVYSATSGILRTRDFGDLSPAELALARRVLTRLPWQLGRRRTRRWTRAGGAVIDLRPMLRRSLQRGEIIELAFRRRRTAPRPIVVIGDVSGSMERYSRVLLHFIYGLARSARHVESFVFATTLTRLSRRLAESGATHELSRVIQEVKDWGGGTRIGESLRLFNTRWARRVMRHGPVVLIVSDGWDRGDPETLAREVQRLRRGCRRLIWLNPLLGSADYKPLTRGLQAALPYVDDFLPAHNIASLEQLAKHLEHLRPH
jgi:uncharacterized protein with von Willebrand factor type A (vWA) domain